MICKVDRFERPTAAYHLSTGCAPDSGPSTVVLSCSVQPPMTRIYFDPERPKPTPMEASSRFWCGAALGTFIGAVVGVPTFWDSGSGIAATVIAAALLAGGLSVRYGEQFWEDARTFIRSLPLW